jgi:hypothetical protein
MKKTLATFFLLSVFAVSAFAQQPSTGNEGAPSTGNEKPAYCATIDRSELETSIIPCGRQVHICYSPENAQCEFKHLFILVNNMARSFIVVVFAPLLTIVLMYIGFLFIKDQAGAKVKAKALLLRVLIGTFFVLGAWLVVNFILSALNVDTEVKKPLQGNNTN